MRMYMYTYVFMCTFRTQWFCDHSKSRNHLKYNSIIIYNDNIYYIVYTNSNMRKNIYVYTCIYIYIYICIYIYVYVYIYIYIYIYTYIYTCCLHHQPGHVCYSWFRYDEYYTYIRNILDVNMINLYTHLYILCLKYMCIYIYFNALANLYTHLYILCLKYMYIYIHIFQCPHDWSPQIYVTDMCLFKYMYKREIIHLCFYFIYTYIYIYIYIHTHIHIYTHIYIKGRLFIHVVNLSHVYIALNECRKPYHHVGTFTLTPKICFWLVKDTVWL
jgi:hypothetical protein